ncbi:MAG: hypothetical protein V9F00_17800 [Nocardioides sp.]
MLRQSFALAVRHEVLPRNPIDNVSRLHKPKRTPTALTAAEVNAIRAVIWAWETTRGTSGPNPDGQFRQIVEVMLGTSARIGEVLAIRRRDFGPAASQDRSVEPGDRAAELHRRGLASADGVHAGPLAGCPGVL